MPDSTSIVSKVWNYAHVLKNAGVGYGDYVEQITYLLFLKLADEMTEMGFDNPISDASLNREVTCSNVFREPFPSFVFVGTLFPSGDRSEYQMLSNPKNSTILPA